MNKTIANQTLKAMREVLAQNFPDFEVKFGNTKFSKDGEIDFKFTMVVAGASEKIQERDTKLGMIKNQVHPNVVDMEFENMGRRFTVVSVKDRKQKYPVLCLCQNDAKFYRFSADLINREAKLILGTSVSYMGKAALLRTV